MLAKKLHCLLRLLLAAWLGSNLLLAIAKPFDSTESDLLSNLMVAAQNDQVRVFMQANERVPNFDWNRGDSAGNTLLHWAAREGNLNVVTWLTQQKIRLDQRNNLQETALMLAVYRGHLSVVKLLRERGAAINHPGWSPLLYAAMTGQVAIAEYLMATGADLGTLAPNGLSPLMLAVREGQYKMVLWLVSAGADVNYQTSDGKTALQLAKQRNFPSIVALLEQAGAEK